MDDPEQGVVRRDQSKRQNHNLYKIRHITINRMIQLAFIPKHSIPPLVASQ
jgi:hypothetical protein